MGKALCAQELERQVEFQLHSVSLKQGVLNGPYKLGMLSSSKADPSKVPIQEVNASLKREAWERPYQARCRTPQGPRLKSGDSNKGLTSKGSNPFAPHLPWQLAFHRLTHLL